MKIIYLIAAYNEAAILPELIEKLQKIPLQFPGSKVIIIDNASTDHSKEILQNLMQKHDWLIAYFESAKGMGVAFRRGLNELKKFDLTSEDWIVFNAVDLPFGFTDLEHFLKIKNSFRALLYVGSKNHPGSKLVRSWKRALGSWIFRQVRSLLLKMKTLDPQGTLFLRADQLFVVDATRSNDYFFTTEVVYYFEKRGPVIEMPVQLMPDVRTSKVHLLRDGLRAIQQSWDLRSRN
ncbi:MAG: glycosyltransferase family 2 protein [Bdellovibrionaceae bacterium]|nr:glycosyltransferase family 2 protein [Pseudobdellovibrionaceae bacterium]